MKKALLLLLTILAIPSICFAAIAVTPAETTWDAATGGNLTFNVTGAEDVTVLNFICGKTRVEYQRSDETKKVEDEYSYTDGVLTIYEKPLTKTPNNSYKMQINDTPDLATVTVSGNPASVAPTEATFDIANPAALVFTLTNVESVSKVVFINGKAEDEWDKGFTYENGTLTLDKDALATYAETLAELGTYKMKVNGEDGLTVAVTFKDTTPTPSSSSGGGGCNAGANALLLLFCAVPSLFKLKR